MAVEQCPDDSPAQDTWRACFVAGLGRDRGNDGPVVLPIAPELQAVLVGRAATETPAVGSEFLLQAWTPYATHRSNLAGSRTTGRVMERISGDQIRPVGFGRYRAHNLTPQPDAQLGFEPPRTPDRRASSASPALMSPSAPAADFPHRANPVS
jgi:hypothetical protein